MSRGLPALGCADSHTSDDVGDALDSFEHRRRSDAAVDADDVGAARDQRRRELLGRRAVEADAVLFGRHLRDDRQIAHRADGRDRRANLVQVAERFEDEEVDLAVEQRLRLLAEHRLRFVDAGLAPRLDAHAERSDRAGHVGRGRRLSRSRAARPAAPPARLMLGAPGRQGRTPRSFIRLAPKVLVSMTSAPAFRYSPVHVDDQVRAASGSATRSSG